VNIVYRTDHWLRSKCIDEFRNKIQLKFGFRTVRKDDSNTEEEV